MSLLANLALLPLLAVYFGSISPHIYLNALWLPLLGWLVLPLALAGTFIWLVPGLGTWSGLCFAAASKVGSGMFSGLAWLDAQGWLQEICLLRPLWPEVFGYWLLILVLALVAAGRRIPWKIVALGLFLFWAAGLGQWLESGHIRLTVLDVGQGQALLVRGPNGRRVLVDGGGSWNPDFDLARFAVLPTLTRGRPPRLDAAVLTHPDFDHQRGLVTVLECCQVGLFAYNGQWPKREDGRRLRRAVGANASPVKVWRAGHTYALGPECRLEVLHPKVDWAGESKNDCSLVLRLSVAGHGLALLCGDIESRGVQALLDSKKELSSEVLVLPHHGSRGSLSLGLYAAVDPDLAVASAGFLHPFGFPHTQVVDALEEHGVRVLDTAGSGAVIVDWDSRGHSRQISQYRLMRP
jgi:competence protein ComEC